jgi:hypothetical protein
LSFGKHEDQEKEVRTMTKLECSVKNCLHNADNCCCKAAIAVDGNKAKTAEQTCCASFDENKGGKFTNLFKTPETRLEIACDAVKCVYNEEHRCSAERIDISGDGACECTETRCSTFKAR